MKTAGIIAEYNPFHNGHKYHIEKTKEETGADHIVAVMSGNYVQRGETAIISKWARAESAIENGVDLVIELPTMWSIARAQDFAAGAVKLINALGCVDVLSFGSECGDIETLRHISEILSDERVIERMQCDLDIGMSFAGARAEAVRTYYGDAYYDILNEPNNILAIEYILANNKYENKPDIFTVKRKGAAHDSIIRSENFASASDIRKMILNDEKWSPFVPQSTVDIFEKEKENQTGPTPYSKLEFSVLCCMRQLAPEDIAETPDVSEGIENRIHDAAQKARTLDELFSLAKTRRYSHARIRRIVLASFLGFTNELCYGLPPYIKVLAMNDKGKEILKEAKEKATLPIVTKASDFDDLEERAKKVYSIEGMCTDVYSLATPVILPCGREQTTPVIVKAIPHNSGVRIAQSDFSSDRTNFTPST